MPLTDNDPGTVERVRAALAAAGVEVVEGEQITGSEDFSWLPRAWDVPYAYWFVGGWDPTAYDDAAARGRLRRSPATTRRTSDP